MPGQPDPGDEGNPVLSTPLLRRSRPPRENLPRPNLRQKRERADHFRLRIPRLHCPRDHRLRGHHPPFLNFNGIHWEFHGDDAQFHLAVLFPFEVEGGQSPP